ncbi:MAG: ABC transporter substrate-binding protein [Thermoplasmatota archaeon]
MRNNIKLISNVAPIFATLAVILVLLLSSTASVIGAGASAEEKVHETRSEDYLTAAFQSQIENLNPLTIQDVWSSQAARDPIYSGLASTHEDTKKTIPWMAYDWSPIGESGSGEYDPSETYEDPDPETVANEGIPSDDLEVIVHMRKNITFHRSEAWYDSGEMWESPYSNFEMEGEKMEVATAQDVVFSAEMTQWSAPLFQSGFLPLNQSSVGDDEDVEDPNWVVNGGDGMYGGIQIVDDYTIRFELDEPYAMFYGGSFPVVLPMHVWDEHTLLDTSDQGALQWDCGQGGSIEDQKKAMVGNGPFMWTEWDKGTYIKLDTNPDYFADGTRDQDKVEGVSMKNVDLTPSFDGIDFQIRSTSSAAVMALKQGDVDTVAWAIEPGSIPDLNSDPNTDTIKTPDFGFFYLAFNMEKPAFGYKDHPGGGEKLETYYPKDVSSKFRQAVAHASDKGYIVNNLLQGYGSVGASVVSPDNERYYNSTVETYAFDLDRAEQLLVEQNQIWRDELDGFDYVWTGTQDGTFKIPRVSGDKFEADGDKIDLLTPTADYDPVRAQAGQRVASDLSELGINIDAKGQNFQSLVGRLDPGQRMTSNGYDIYVLGWSIGGFEALGSLESFFHSRNDKPGGYNMPGFRNERFDELVEKAEKEMDQNKRADLVRQLQGIISEELPYNVLFFRDQVNGYNVEWQGWVDWPGGIWNSFSWGHVTKGGGKTLEIDLESPDMNKGGQQDVTVSLTEEGTPVEGEEISLSIDQNATLGSTTGTTNADGEFTTTLTAPSDIEDTIILTLTVETSEGIQRTESINVYPQELPPINVDVDVDYDEIAYDEDTEITITLTSPGEDLTGADISVNIDPTTGSASLEPNIIQNYSGEATMTFQAPGVEKGETTGYTLEFTASKTGFRNGYADAEISVTRADDTTDGPSDGNETNGDSPGLGILPALIGTAFTASVYAIYRRRRNR